MALGQQIWKLLTHPPQDPELAPQLPDLLKDQTLLILLVLKMEMRSSFS